jgi:hypothetical protein
MKKGPPDPPNNVIELEDRKNDPAWRQKRAENRDVVQQRVEKITKKALKRAKSVGEFDIAVAMAELEEARQAALASFPVQASAAVNATAYKAKLTGILIERTEHGRPGTFAQVKTQEDILRIIEQRAGPQAVELFKNFIGHLDKKLIDITPEREE